MLFFHFTSCFWLPDIVREGLDHGELPIDLDKYRYCDAQAVNLTTNPDPADNWRIWCAGAGVDKSRIRISIELPESEVTTFREIREKYQTPEKWLKKLAPYEERKRWFYYFGRITPDRFTEIAIREGRSYRTMSPDEVEHLANNARDERERCFTITIQTAGRQAGSKHAKLKPGIPGSWLIDGPEAEKEFGV